MGIERTMMGAYRLNKVWALSWPVILEMLSLLLGGLVLTAIVGRFGAASQAAVGLTITMQMAVAIIMSAAGTGAGVLVAQAFGAHRYELVRTLSGQALVLAFGGGVILVLFGVPFAGFMVTLSGLTGEVGELTRSFLQISFTFIPFVVIIQVCAAILRAIGQTKLSFLIAITNNAVLIIVAYYLLFYTDLGAMGGIIAISLGQACGCILGLFLLSRSWTIGLFLKDIYKIRRDLLKQILDISIPAALEQGALQGGRIVYTLMLAGLGATQLAAHNIALQVESLSFMPGAAFGMAALTLVGQNIGRGLPFQAERYAKLCTWLAVVGMSLMGVVFFIFAPNLARIFTEDPEVHRWTTLCIRWAALEQPTLAMSLVLSGVLRSTKDTRGPMVLTFIGVWVVRIPLMGLLLYFGELTVERAWMITVMDFGVRSVLLYWRFKKIDWKGLCEFHRVRA